MANNGCVHVNVDGEQRLAQERKLWSYNNHTNYYISSAFELRQNDDKKGHCVLQAGWRQRSDRELAYERLGQGEAVIIYARWYMARGLPGLAMDP